MAVAFLAFLLAVYAALFWHCAGNFAQHHRFGRMRRRWALHGSRLTVLGLKFLLLAFVTGVSFHLLQLHHAVFIFIQVLPFTLGLFLVAWLAPGCLVFSLGLRAVELVCGTSFESTTQQQGVGFSAVAEEAEIDR